MKGVLSQCLGASLEESRDVAEFLAQKRGIKDHESMSDDKLLDAIISSKSEKQSEMPKFLKARVGEIEKKN